MTGPFDAPDEQARAHPGPGDPCSRATGAARTGHLPQAIPKVPGDWDPDWDGGDEAGHAQPPPGP